MKECLKEKLYTVGDLVPVSGYYRCIPCDYVQQFKAGERFTPCDACQAGTELGPEGYKDNEEDFWMFVQ